MNENAETTDIAELFARDPANLVRSDIKAMIADFRDKRHLFVTQGKQPKASSAKKPRSSKMDADTQDLAAKLNIEV